MTVCPPPCPITVPRDGSTDATPALPELHEVTVVPVGRLMTDAVTVSCTWMEPYGVKVMLGESSREVGMFILHLNRQLHTMTGNHRYPSAAAIFIARSSRGV